MFKEYNQNQIQLLPPDLSSLITSDHLARFINQAIDGMDISFIEKLYSSNGQHAYPPRMLLKVLIYGYSIGVRSSRKLADRLCEDIVFMWLSGRLTPDFRTIADFRKEKLFDFKKIFEQVLETCFFLGMAKVGKVCFDGTKVLANASTHKVIYRKQLLKRKQLIKTQIEDIIKEAEKIDEEEDRLYGNATPHRTGKVFNQEEVARVIKKLEKERSKLKKKKAILKAKTQEITKKERLMRQDRNSFSNTDKDATVMLMKEGYPAPGYNVQLATEHQVILGYGLSSDRNDTKLLKPMVEEVKVRTKRKPETVIADPGYGVKKNYRYLKRESISHYIPYNNYQYEKKLRNKGLYTPPKNPDPEFERYKLKIRKLLESVKGKKMLNQRKKDIEPVIGNLKANLGFRRFILRGKKKCEVELGIFSLVHNLKKIKNWLQKLKEWQIIAQETLKLDRKLSPIPEYLPIQR